MKAFISISILLLIIIASLTIHSYKKYRAQWVPVKFGGYLSDIEISEVNSLHMVVSLGEKGEFEFDTEKDFENMQEIISILKKHPRLLRKFDK